MNNTKIQDLINRENEAREEQTLREARTIINDIMQQQATIDFANKKIAQLREELKALEVTQVNAATILGE